MPPAFSWPVRVYWEDTDGGGVVYYANYLKFFERARTEWLRQRGLQQHTLKTELGGMFVVTDARVHYRHPARLDDQLCITVHPKHMGRVQCELHQQAWLLEPKPTSGTCAPISPSVADMQTQAQLLCEGEIRLAWVQADNMRPQRIPNGVLHKLQHTA